MTRPLRHAALALALSLLGTAQAAPAPKEMVDQYYKMCLEAVNMPKPFGEYDLKGNAKLPQYCKCFAPKFSERAMVAMTELQAGKKAPPLEQSNKEELAMRNVCRKETGLPAAVEPK